jgi:hypothetical protein
MSYLADPDVWMKPMTQEDGFEYWKYIWIYTDDILCISMNPREALDKIDMFFPMKPGLIGPQDIYLGAKVTKVKLPNGVFGWVMGPSKKIQKAVTNAKEWMQKNQPDSYWS